jgi:hypothetical protein
MTRRTFSSGAGEWLAMVGRIKPGVFRNEAVSADLERVAAMAAGRAPIASGSSGGATGGAPSPTRSKRGGV